MKKNTINGVINVYKEKGYTSHDVVAKLRGILKIKKIGHTGTLDPNAEGVLPVCIGNATKLCDMIMEKTKEYEAELVLGVCTDTQDLTGKILESVNISDMEKDCDPQYLEKVIHSFIGKYSQIPPMYSAIKVNGRKLYDMARAGIEVERKPREVEFYAIEILENRYPRIKIKVSCSKGTYIRTLCYDIGQKMGIPSCMGDLLRVKSGMFSIDYSVKLSEIEEIVKKDQLDESGILTKTEDVLSQYKKIYVCKEFEKLLMNGNVLTDKMIYQGNDDNVDESDKNMFRVYNNDNEFVGVFEYHEGIYKPEKMFL